MKRKFSPKKTVAPSRGGRRTFFVRGPKSLFVRPSIRHGAFPSSGYPLPNWNPWNQSIQSCTGCPGFCKKNPICYVLRTLVASLRGATSCTFITGPNPLLLSKSPAVWHPDSAAYAQFASYSPKRTAECGSEETPIVFCSEFLRKEANTALPDHFESTHVVYNGADGRKFRSAKRDRNSVPTIIYTGRLVPYKGVHVLLDAMRILESKKISAKCKIVGGARFGNSNPTRYVRKLRRRRSRTRNW